MGNFTSHEECVTLKVFGPLLRLAIRTMAVFANNNKCKTAPFSLIFEPSSCYLSTVQHEITISVKSTQPSQNPQQYKKKNSFGQQQLNRQK